MFGPGVYAALRHRAAISIFTGRGFVWSNAPALARSAAAATSYAIGHASGVAVAG
jgi:hypothetical protein